MSAIPPDDSEAHIRVRSLTRHYTLGSSLIRAVDDVSLEIRQGEFVALLGSSGSGKSTLLHMLAGLDHPTSGTLAVQGKDLGSLNPNELAAYRRDIVGMIFQSFNLVPSMTIAENVELPLRFAEVERSARGERVRTALQRVGLGERLQHKPSELSGGEQQRASIARALVNGPKILLADEPTGNLDSRNGEEIMNLIRELNDSSRMTVLLVTHEQKLAELYADRLLIMGDGRLKSDTPIRAGVRS